MASKKYSINIVIHTKRLNESLVLFNENDKHIPVEICQLNSEAELLGFPTFQILKDKFLLETEYINRIKLFKLTNKESEQQTFLTVEIDDPSRVNQHVYKWENSKHLDKYLLETHNIPSASLVE